MFTASVSFQSDGTIEEETVLKAEDSFDTASEITPHNRVCYPRTENERSDTDKNATKANQVDLSFQMAVKGPERNWSRQLDEMGPKTIEIGWSLQLDKVGSQTNRTDSSLQMDEADPQTNPSLHIDEVSPINPNFQTDEFGPQTNPNFEMDEVCPQTNPNCQIDEVCPQTNQGDPSFQIAQFDTTFNGLHPVRFLRRLFRWLCFCNHTSEIDTDKEALTNPGFSTEDADESSHSVALSGEPESGSVFSGSSSCPDDGGSSNQSTIMEEIQHVILPKEDLLELFDKMCQEAKEMNINVVGRVVQIFNFAAAMLDSRGGFLSIDALGVHLYIPPGAIPVEELSQRVYVYVQGGLTSGGNYLTPYVHCGPSGFHFSKDVFLILPHCAKEAVGTEFSCIKSTSSGLQKLEGGKDGTLLVKTNSVLMTMSHFCGLAAYGSPSVKFMVACVFIKGMPNGRLMVRVRLFDDTKANFQEVKTVETKNGFNQVDMREHLEVRRCDPGKDIKMSMCSDVHSWEITEPERGWQTIQHSILWREYGPENLPSLPSKIFQASVCAASQTEAFQGSLKIFQEGREDHSVDFIVNFSPNAVKPRSPEQATEERIREICRQQILEQLRGPSCSETRLLDEDIMNKLCSLLDDISPIGRDWRMLPENLTGLKSKGHSWVESIEIRTASWPFRSPTEFVLDAFFAASRESKIGERCTLEELKKGLLSLSRLDIHFAIQAITDKLKQGKHGIDYRQRIESGYVSGSHPDSDDL
ncbi:UNC5C-like protein [Acanthaster planci]|uniref:Netrin receptor UNC5 n=1 Tax=Acanthaster planci TaxID=133434 RepID=A0A8B7ZIC1_ACAPL|nr:UNC5C-like protein [Acanthaster planci]XP_022105310.1 UNC5C-like protein [Acanthaster planci]